MEYSTAFMNPESNHHIFIITSLRACHQHSLKDFGHISQVKSIVRFCWSWSENFCDL